MNALNQMIAQGGRPIQIESPLNQMAQFEQIRGGQQANMLRQQQMADIQREREQLQTVNRLYGEAYDPATGRIDESRLYGRLAESGFGSQIPGLQEQSSKGRKAAAEAARASTESALKRIDLKRTQLENVKTFEGYVDWALSSFDDPVLSPILQEIGSTPDKVLEHVLEFGTQPEGLQNLIEESKLGSDKFAQLVKDRAGQAITVRGQDISAQTTRRGQDITAQTTRRGQDITTRGQDISAQTTRRGQDITAQTTRRGQDLTERRERDVDLQARVAEARTRAAELAKNQVSAQAALPSAIENANAAIRLIDEMIGDAQVSKDGKKWEVPKNGRQPSPGFTGYVGLGVPGMRFIEGSDEASFERSQLQLEGQKFLDAFASLRGGGAITQIEGEKATQAILRANKAQSEVEYIKAMREAQFHARRAVAAASKKAGVNPRAMNPADMSDDELRQELGL